MKQENIIAEGTVVEELGNSMFRVQIEKGPLVLCTISGKIRKNFVKIMKGDSVKIEMSPYDLTKGRISFRYPPVSDLVVNNNEKTFNKKNAKKK